ncbi:hypothetical protein AgCh_024486 [Apium graveolens]
MLVMGAVLGILQTICLISLARPLLGIMGVRFVRFFLLEPAKRYLKLRSLGALTVLLPLSMQGVFRGFKNTTTTLYATVVEDLVNVVLDPFLYLFAIWELVVQQLLMCFLGFYLLGRVIATTSCVTLVASLAASVALHIMGPTTDMVGPTVDVAKMRPTADVTSGTPADVAR